MEAGFSGGDLYLLLQGDKDFYGLIPKELSPLRQIPIPPDKGRSIEDIRPEERGRLTTKLKLRSGEGSKDTNCDVTLEFVETTNDRQGIDVEFTPPEALPWDRVEKIEVRVADRLYQQFAIEGIIASCYRGDNVIRIRS